MTEPVTEGKRESAVPATVSPVEGGRLETKVFSLPSSTPSVVHKCTPSLVQLGRGETLTETNGIQTTFIEPVEPFYTPHDIASMMIGRWKHESPSAPPKAQVKKQFRIAVLLANEYEPFEIAQAWDGMAHTYPYSKGEVWDMFDLRRSFGKAFQNATTELNEDVRWEAFFNREE